jgi:hypothetical protein
MLQIPSGEMWPHFPIFQLTAMLDHPENRDCEDENPEGYIVRMLRVRARRKQGARKR